MGIYLSGWSPQGVRKSWDRTSISNDSATAVLAGWAVGNVIDACAWSDADGSLRVLVADTDSKRRHIYRRTPRGDWSLQTDNLP